MNKEIDLILFIGQSNMAGRGVTCEKYPETAPLLTEGMAYEYRAISSPGHLLPLCEPFGVDENNENGINDVFSGGVKAKTGSLASAFCKAYYERLFTTIVGVSASKGGSTISKWLPSSSSGYLKDAVERLTAAKDYLVNSGYTIKRKLALWCQGESDGDENTSPMDYQKMFLEIWQELYKNLDDIFIIQIGNCNIEGSYDRYREIQEAQRELPSLAAAAGLTDSVHFCCNDFASMREQGLMRDAFHYYQKGYNICGESAGKNVADYYAKNRL